MIKYLPYSIGTTATSKQLRWLHSIKILYISFAGGFKNVGHKFISF